MEMLPQDSSFTRPGKRKAEDFGPGPNPLLKDAAAKRAKIAKFPFGGSSKRQPVLNHEQVPQPPSAFHVSATHRQDSSISTPTPTRTGNRRKSSVSGRGKRVSTSFETSGIITQPHNSVPESSFYKHIDPDLPDPERIRQLLIWCSLRAAATPPVAPCSLSSSKPSKLPPLSNAAAQALKASQEEIVRNLAERKIDLSMYNSEARSKEPQNKQEGELRENEQNVRNRMWEVTYTSHIQQAQAEEEAWKKVSYRYEAYAKQLQGSLEARSADLRHPANGKRRATTTTVADPTFPENHHLCPTSQSALHLAKSVLRMHRPETDERGRWGLTPTTPSGSRDRVEAEIERLMPQLVYTLDQIHSWMRAGKATTDVAEQLLNQKFDVLSANLASRVTPLPSSSSRTTGEGPSGGGSGSGTTGQQLLSTYVVPERETDPVDLLRALSRIDEERPPAQVGDAARRAAKEVQRAGEAGFAGSVGGEKKLTTTTTPRKMMTPGTPRRGNTPGR